MMTIRTMKQIATSSVIPSCRSIPNLNRYSVVSLDQARIATGIQRQQQNALRRHWLNQLYSQRRCPNP